MMCCYDPPFEDPNIVKSYCIICSDDGDYGYVCEDCKEKEREEYDG
jgi:hypothetical protein